MEFHAGGLQNGEKERRKPVIGISDLNSDFEGWGYLPFSKQILEYTFIKYSKPYYSLQVIFEWLEMDKILTNTSCVPLTSGRFQSHRGKLLHRNLRNGREIHPELLQSLKQFKSNIYPEISSIIFSLAGPAPNGKIHIVRDKVKHNIWKLWDLGIFWVNPASLKIIPLIIYQCLFFLDDDGNDDDDDGYGKHEDYDDDGDGSGDDGDVNDDDDGRALGPPVLCSHGRHKK